MQKKKIKLTKKKKQKLIKTSIPIILSLICLCLLITYIRFIDKRAKIVSEETNYTYIQKEVINGSEGFYLADVKNNLKTLFNKKKEIEATFTYKINNENFYFEIAAKKENDNITFTINKIVDNKHKVRAKMKYQNIEKVEYRTGNSNHSTVLKLYTDSEAKYLVFTGNTYYFLGDDIETISYNDEHFYYVSYNRNYELLKEADSCNKELKKSIDEFNEKDYYYKYGKINFLTDYYQKLSSKTYLVGDRCSELEETKEEDQNKTS